VGKVYDALQRAEEERGRSGEKRAATRQGSKWQPAGPGEEVRPAKRRGLLRQRERVEQESANASNKRRLALLRPESFVAEQFRTLRARLDSIGTQRPLRTIAVTSALRGEGKSTAAVNLAIVTALQTDRRPLLVDLDFRQPAVHRALGVTPRAGVGEVLSGDATLETAISQVEGLNLCVLPVRSKPAHPSEQLASDKMRALIEELARSYEPIILDTPPTLGLPDVKAISEYVDGIVLVVRADATPREDIEAALDLLDRRRILGIVLNSVHLDVERYDYRAS